MNLRSEAYTTGILLEAWVVEALLLRQGTGPAIALGGRVGSVLFLLLSGLELLLGCFYQDLSHPIVDKRRIDSFFLVDVR